MRLTVQVNMSIVRLITPVIFFFFWILMEDGVEEATLIEVAVKKTTGQQMATGFPGQHYMLVLNSEFFSSSRSVALDKTKRVILTYY